MQNLKESPLSVKSDPGEQKNHNIQQNYTANQFIKVIWGRTTGCFRLIDDSNQGLHAKNINGDYNDLEKDFKIFNSLGFGIFFGVNSGGHTDTEITDYNACFIDYDAKGTMPDEWHLEPTIICERGKNCHVYWLLEGDVTELQFRTLQKQLAQHYNSDPTVINPSRVMRLPGYINNKPDAGDAYQVKWNNTKNRYTVDILGRGLKPVDVVEPIKGDDKSIETPVNISKAIRYLQTRPDITKGGRNKSLYEYFSMLSDFGLSIETSIELYQEHAAHKCNPALSDREITEVARNAHKYKKSHQGSKATSFGGVDLPEGCNSQQQGLIKAGSEEHIYHLEQPLEPYEWHPLHVSSNGKPRATYHNFKTMIDRYGITINYDVIQKRILIKGQGMHDTQNDKAANANYSKIFTLCKMNQFDVGAIDSYLHIEQATNPINPVEDWITSEQWDGKDRIDELFNTLMLDPEQDRDIAHMLFRKWFIGACAIVLGKIDSYEHVLILQASKGGEGKTRWFSKLCPHQWRIDGHIFDPADKDSVMKAIGNWLVELGEIDSTFRKSDIKKLMSFLSNEKDRIRLPYAKVADDFKRRTAFFGSVNNKGFLVDESGDRRFWPISVTSVNYNHSINMQQFWAQVKTLIEKESPRLDRDELKIVIEANREFKAIEPIHEALQTYFDNIPNNCEMEKLNATEVYRMVFDKEPSKSQCNKTASWLRENFKKVWRKSSSVFLVPYLNVSINGRRYPPTA